MMISTPGCLRVTSSVSLRYSVLLYVFLFSYIMTNKIERILLGKDQRLAHMKARDCSNFHVVNISMLHTFCKCSTEHIEVLINVLAAVPNQAKTFAGNINAIRLQFVNKYLSFSKMLVFVPSSPSGINKVGRLNTLLWHEMQNCHFKYLCSWLVVQRLYQKLLNILVFGFYSAFQSSPKQAEHVRDKWTTFHIILIFQTWHQWEHSNSDVIRNSLPKNCENFLASHEATNEDAFWAFHSSPFPMCLSFSKQFNTSCCIVLLAFSPISSQISLYRFPVPSHRWIFLSAGAKKYIMASIASPVRCSTSPSSVFLMLFVVCPFVHFACTILVISSQESLSNWLRWLAISFFVFCSWYLWFKL